MAKPSLPDAEELLAALTAQMRPHVTAKTGLIGIVTGGAWLAERLHRDLKLEVPHGSLDVSFYRDDFQHKGLKHQVMPSAIPFEVEGRDLILVDDVLYTGRTIRAAMNELFDYGRPRSITLVVLIDRGGRQLPICAQHCGARLELPERKRLRLKRDADGALRLELEDAA